MCSLSRTPPYIKPDARFRSHGKPLKQRPGMDNNPSVWTGAPRLVRSKPCIQLKSAVNPVHHMLKAVGVDRRLWSPGSWLGLLGEFTVKESQRWDSEMSPIWPRSNTRWPPLALVRWQLTLNPACPVPTMMVSTFSSILDAP